MDREEFLHTFFTNVSQQNFDKAKECLNKDEEYSRHGQLSPWGTLLVYLNQLATTERSYLDLCFLHVKNKGFLRKESSLKITYEFLRDGFKKLEKIAQEHNPSRAIVCDISGQLCSFIGIRIQLIEFYEKMYTMSTNSKTMQQCELLKNIEEIVHNHYLLCSHMALVSIKASLTLECEILEQLTNAQINIQEWRFLPTIMALYGAQARMSAWEKTLQNKEDRSWKFGFGASFLKTNQQPALYQWLVKLRGVTLAKSSLYFHTTLSQQASPGDMRSIMSKQSVDYYQKMQQFQKKHDIIVVALIFDSRGSSYFEKGYKHPKREEINSNTENFSFVVTCPYVFLQKPSTHWDAVPKLIEKHSQELISQDKIVFEKGEDESINVALINVEPRMTLVVMFENGKQKGKDSSVSVFMNEFSMNLRCTKIYEHLKLQK